MARAQNPLGREFSEALSRGLVIMTSLGEAGGSLSLSELARRVDLPRATVRRALLTLVHLGYAVEDGRQFSLTPQVLRLAAAYLGSSHAAAILQPRCESLAAEYDATFSVAALEGEDAVMVAYATPRRMYMEARGIGRVLLAGLPPIERERFLAQLTPRAITPLTVTDKQILGEILAQVGRSGFAIAEAEAELGFRSLAVPIRRVGGPVVYALNTGMPVERCSSEVMQATYLDRLLSEAESLSQHLL